MATDNYAESLFAAIEEKSSEMDSRTLPELLENYRVLHACEKTVFDFLLKKSLITPDAYKHEKRISDIAAPEIAQFSETDMSAEMGTRLSDYDSMLDFICHYYKFSVSSLTLPKIKKFFEFNRAIHWNSFSVNAKDINTRSIATLLNRVRQGSDTIALGIVYDSVKKAGNTLDEINDTLKSLSEFQKEAYKAEIRKKVFTHHGFNANEAASSAEGELAQIKKHFSSAMEKVTLYTDLVNEVVQEDHAPNKETLRKNVLNKLKATAKKSEKKESKVDTKELLMIAVRVFAAMSGQIMQALTKIQENHDVLEAEHNSFFDKLKKLLKKAFNIEEKPLFYNISVTDSVTGTKHNEKLNYNHFIEELEQRAKRYNALGNKNSPFYEKIHSTEESKILEFVNNQISDCQKMLKTMTSLDDFFKNTVHAENRLRIKGLGMEITAIKNSIVKANQHRSEYTAYVEEAEQLKKLGISNND